MKRMGRNILIQRSAGLLLLLTVFVLLDPLQGNILHRLLLPIAAVLGGALILRSTMAIALATGTLAALATNMNGDLYQSQVYPLLALVAFLVAAIFLIRRFQTRIKATHAERWFERRHKPLE